MIAKLKQLLSELSTAEPHAQQYTIELAATCLLFELSKVDMTVSDCELKDIGNALSTMFKLEKTDIAALINDAKLNTETSTSTFEFTTVIKEHFDAQQRIALVKSLWKVAFADGVLDKYEEHFIRKISDLLYVSHSDFIRTKHEAQSAGH